MEPVDVSKVTFDHVQLYVNSVAELPEYLALQEKFNAFSSNLSSVQNPSSQPYQSYRQDLVRQLITGFGFRIIAAHFGEETRSVLISTSPTGQGTQFLITAPQPNPSGTEKLEHFQAKNLQEFLSVHHGRQGVGVLAFRLQDTGAAQKLFLNYKEKHPKLLRSDEVKVFESPDGVFKYFEASAFYLPDGPPDQGTVLRFIERSGSFSKTFLPGLSEVSSAFPSDVFPSFNDHWVNNVHNRKQFLETLEDVLGFTPKVDFNAGVVAAGEAIIESTVTGNTSKEVLSSKEEALKDQSQIFLPINNAMSEVGHVHLFLKEIGQGVQHIASRVDNLVAFVQRANHYRNATGEGFSFLKIPRSYYGRLSESDLLATGASKEATAKLISHLVNANLMDIGGIVKSDVVDKEIEACIEGVQDADITANKQKLIEAIKRSRYINMYKLLKDRMTEEEYLNVVSNQVLVDVQGDDILYQIFTANILQENPIDEAPFLEFIQRTCRKVEGQPIRAGCGGFGIRNFLTLFLSIEVTKAMTRLDEAVKDGNTKAADNAKKMIDVFTHQLEVSNPILTTISDAMTEEARAIEELATVQDDKKQEVEERIAKFNKLKLGGQQELMRVSDEHCRQMADIRAAFDSH